MRLASSVVVISNGPADWIAILVAVLALLGSILTGVMASRSTRMDKRFEAQANRAAELESRNSERKYEMYKPIIEWWGMVIGAAAGQQNTMTPDETIKLMLDFTTWVTIYGSDDVVIAYHNFRQAAFKQSASHDVPVSIIARLYVDFLLAVRRDLGYPDSKIGAREVLGIRIDDLYTAENSLTMTLPLDVLCEREHWVPPWATNESDRPGTSVTDGGSTLSPSSG